MKQPSRKWALCVLALALIGAGLACHIWAHVHYRAATRALARHDLAAAQAELASCLKVWSRSTDTLLLAARTARRAGDFDQAESYLRDCRDLGGPEKAIDLEHKLLRVQRGYLSQVERPLVSMLNQNHPDTPLIAEVLTPAFLQTYQLDNVGHCIQCWLAHEPDSIEAWRYSAKLAEVVHNGDEVLACYRRLVELEPDNDETRLLLAGQLINAHRPQEALQEFEHVRPRVGDTPLVLGGIACCERELGHGDEARRLLERVLAEDPHNGMALGERGRLALQFESPAEGEKWLRRALVERPAEREYLYSLLQCLLRQKDKRKEAEELQAQLKKVEGDLDRLRELTRRLASDPHNADLRCEAGQIMLRNGQATEGLRWLNSALQEDPNHAATRQALAEYHRDRKGTALENLQPLARAPAAGQVGGKKMP